MQDLSSARPFFSLSALRCQWNPFAANAALSYLTLSADGRAVRCFPIGACTDIPIPLVVVEFYPAGICFNACLAAPRGVSGTVVLDIGLVKVDAGK